MSDKHSLADEKVHSLSEEFHPLDRETQTIGVYPNENEARERYSSQEQKPVKGLWGFITFVVVVVALFIGTMVFIYHLSSNTAENQPTTTGIDYKSLDIPPKLDSMEESTNGKTGRELTITRAFTGIVVSYSGGSTPSVTFDIDGTQQQYRFRMGNEGKVAIGGKYKVGIQYWNIWWDFSAVEQIK